MSWVPWNESGLPVILDVSDDVVSEGGRFVCAGVGSGGGSWFNINQADYEAFPDGIKVRVTVESYSAGVEGPYDFDATWPAYIYFWNEEHPADEWPAVPFSLEYTTAGGASSIAGFGASWDDALYPNVPRDAFSILVEVWDGDGPDPGPSGGCFWTDIVGATQVCGTTPPPSGGLAFVNTEGHGGGFGSMRVVFEHPVAADVCAPGVVDLLSTASSVVITGYIYDAAENAEDLACNYPAPSGSFSPVNFEMAYDYTPPFGEWRYYMESEEQEPLQGYHYVRLLVNGVTEIVGVMHRGSGV